MERKGQKFWNALTKDQKQALIGTDFDPFYSDEREAVDRAIEFLRRQGLW